MAGVPWWHSRLRYGIVTAMAQVQSLAHEFLHAMGADKKKKSSSIFGAFWDSELKGKYLILTTDLLGLTACHWKTAWL